MNAAWYEKNGAAREVLTVGELPTPQPGPGDVLVRVHVSGVNPSDVKSRKGRPLPGLKVVPHSDGAGIVEAVGEGVPQSRIGERVWLWNGQWKRAFGTAAEYIALPSRQAVKLPDSVDFATAACLGIPGLTAMHAVNLLAPIEGKTVLVTGAASAVGHAVTQIATARGAKVIGTASGDKIAHAKAAGASAIIDYKSEDVAARVLELTGGKGTDAIIDMDFSTTVRLLPGGVLAAHGKYVGYGSNIPGDNSVPFGDLLFRSLTLQFFVVYELQAEERARAIADLHGMLEQGTLVHTIGARFSLEETAAAHETVEAGRVIGNVVIDLAD
ncbi:NADPH2:quinone reductase [Mesorhizobium albiziae]|uniref:NADPH2:quinone reductase n=1 Tax=Neomesorhizobium albiziae TaxID=335020 RepID=A0A1I4B4I2_9HYPH|nr:NADPH:quinone reductase [Mesorhizobium albiziae]GLS34327.1 alcohol dehydrogenase [Mesorhizobium albiziae]SFK63695.1 NADPH2:quinone reductase [Mesorhizobium albiziae]